MGVKSKYGAFTKAFRFMAVERLKRGENLSALCRELGVSRETLYTWRDRQAGLEDQPSPPAQGQEAALRQQIARLQRLLADKTLEVDFLKAACAKVEAQHRSSTGSGETASGKRSGN
jgi:transposase-like protein